MSIIPITQESIMRVHQVFLFLAILFLVSSRAPAERKDRLIFPPQDKHVHSSCLVETPNGDLLACWFHGSGERSAEDVQIQGARLGKGEENWSEVFPMADTAGIADCNPIMFVDAKERLHLVWIAVLAKGWQHALTRTRLSEDYAGDGPPVWKWQDLILLRPGEAFADTIKKRFEELNVEEGWGEYAPPYTELVYEAGKDAIKRQTGWMPRIRPLRLESGRILLPLYHDGFNVSMIAISDDEGDTWYPSEPLVGFGPIQPTLLQKKDGTIVAYMRDSGPPPSRVLTSESKDEGLTWTAVVDTDIPNPGSSLAGVALKNGEWVIVLNDTEKGRHQMAMWVSDDEGKSWKWKRYLEKSEDDNAGSYAYPNILLDRDGMLNVNYTYRHQKDGGNKSIKHVVVEPDWAKKGDR
jgi:predicted neuraminidase